jgi:hypothetical protein
LGASGLALALVLTTQAAPEPNHHWAFHPARPFEPPAVKQARWMKPPVDRFIREQVAGEEIFANSKPETRNPELPLATVFNLQGPDMVDSADQVQRRCYTLNGMAATTAAVLLAQTMGCARCHGHKFEPFTQRD